MSNDNKPRIGFIGLGIMGKPMALNLINKGGYSLTVYNRTPSKTKELRSLGASVAASPKQAAEESDVVIAMVTDAPDVEEVMLGNNGIIEGGREGLIAIDMGTNSPGTAKSIALALAKRKIRLLDAPVSGGDKGAKEGTLAIMVGGEKEAFDFCLPIFQSMGKTIFYMGKSGSGQATKLCNQALVAIHTLATSEALLLGSTFGLDLNDLLKVLGSGAAGSWNLSNLGPKIVVRDFEPGFKASHLQKDLKAIIRAAEKENLVLPGSSTLHELFSAVLADENGEKGTQVIATVLEKLARREIRNK